MTRKIMLAIVLAVMVSGCIPVAHAPQDTIPPRHLWPSCYNRVTLHHTFTGRDIKVAGHRRHSIDSLSDLDGCQLSHKQGDTPVYICGVCGKQVDKELGQGIDQLACVSAEHDKKYGDGYLLATTKKCLNLPEGKSVDCIAKHTDKNIVRACEKKVYGNVKTPDPEEDK
ncbi:MAG: hypothetical protein OXF42_05455 [Candidatus Dadabacteria bacterium]|nr:hypothetical protein [Candidatus Dadabacteria bacterium]